MKPILFFFPRFLLIFTLLIALSVPAVAESRTLIDRADAPVSANPAISRPRENAPEPMAKKKKKPKYKIALTFDDGPSKNTVELLKIFDKYGVHATFFVVGNRVADYPDTTRKIIEQGSEIACHTWSHENLTKLDDWDMTDQIEMARQAVYDVVDTQVKFLRPPYGAFDDNVKRIAGELGMPLVNWTIDSEDWSSKDEKLIYDGIINEAIDGRIVLCHDLYDETVAAMKKVVPKLIDMGYDIVTVSDLLDTDGWTSVPGEVYFRRPLDP